MKEKFTGQAEKVLALAKKNAQSCKHSYIGTEHILMGLILNKEATAGMVLEEAGIVAEKISELIDKLIVPSGGFCRE